MESKDKYEDGRTNNSLLIESDSNKEESNLKINDSLRTLELKYGDSILTDIYRLNITSNNSDQQSQSTINMPLSVLNETVAIDDKMSVTNEGHYTVKNLTKIEVNGSNLSSTEIENSSKMNIPTFRQNKLKHEISKNGFTNEDLQKGRQGLDSRTNESENKIIIRILVLYMKAQHGHVTKSDFLKEVNPTNPYKNMRDLIIAFKGNKEIPSDIWKNLEQWDSLNENSKMPKPAQFNEDYEDYYDAYPTETTS